MCKPLGFIGHFLQQWKNCQVTNKCHECLDIHTSKTVWEQWSGEGSKGGGGRTKEEEVGGQRRTKEEGGAGSLVIYAFYF